MYHQGIVTGSAVRAASLLALASAGLVSLAATAATAAAASPPVTVPADYSCSLGQGLAPLNIPAALSASRTGLTVTVTLATQPVQVPAAMAAALPQLDYLGIAGTAQANGMSGTAVRLSGQSGYLGGAAGGMTRLPAMTATGTASQTSQDAAAVQVPPALTLTPVGPAQAAPGTPITCTTTSATTVQVSTVQVSMMAGAAASAPGQAYTCTVTVGTSAPTVSRVPMRLTATGPATVGRQVMVMLAAPVSAFGSAFPVSAVPMSVSGVAGLNTTDRTDAVNVAMTGLADTGNGMFRLTGPWIPDSAGLARILAPHRFTAQLRERTAVTVAVACTAATVSTTTTQVTVQAAVSAAGVASASAPAAAPGAPDTGAGGSLHPGTDLPLAAAGATAVLAGLGITLYVRRRGLNG